MDAREYLNWMTGFYGLKPIGVEINPDLLSRKHLRGAYDPQRGVIILKKPTIETADDMAVIYHEFLEKVAPWLKHPGKYVDLRGMSEGEQQWAPYAKGGSMSVGVGDASKQSEIPFEMEFRIGEIVLAADVHVKDAKLRCRIEAGNVTAPVFDDIYDIKDQTVDLADAPKGALEVKPNNKLVLEIIKTAGTTQEFRWYASGWRRWK